MIPEKAKTDILNAIQSFSDGNLTQNGLALFKALGYITDRQANLDNPVFEEFRDNYIIETTKFNETNALVADWKYVDVLFQLSKEEVLKQTSLFDTKQVDRTIIETYLFITIELNGNEYTRTQLSAITREVNRVFPMPVLILFKYSDLLTLTVINRRLHKRDESKDVLEKVTQIKDIRTDNPHRAHIEILFDLSFDELNRKYSFTNFVELHNAWQKTLDIKELNKRFYIELQTWYFWAIKEVVFPGTPNRFDYETDEKWDEAVKEHKGKNIIRLLTRILFIWFIKEKKLIPEQIFDENILVGKLIKEFEPQKPHGIFATGKHNSLYYRAILQNLFFATLNQEMGKREFRKDGQNQNATNLMRYKSYFKDSEYFVELMESVVPFMNGGLFECLDKPHPTLKGKMGGDIIIYTDGFSDREDNELQVPDYLFFDVDEDVDLSEEIGSKDKAYKNAKTRGLLEILKSYKFTITENTPIDEDVALDPELLGKVFENLLASYNPETKTTARKQTGSFYTPREIVNYMVDESLIAYLKNKLGQLSVDDGKLDSDLHDLLSYNDCNPFATDANMQKQLIKSLDECTILDPACGSGAFPMGILHKMVHVLHKIDPNNTEWKHRQLEKAESIDDDTTRDNAIRDIEESFANNELDYGRKLYLIENCIYGVDIQPIATQISKLRFFISLIVDQRIDKNKPNFGIRPLPNLETKFVAANTLIGIEKPKKQLNLFDNQEIKLLENELKRVRHRLFSAKVPATKRKLREEDKLLREQIAEALIQDGWENSTARQLAGWDPYDQNVHSDFFDPEWMFDIKEGFDIVIGNPPYVDIKGLPKDEVNLYFKIFETTENRINLYSIFIEKGVSLLNEHGILVYINPNSILINESYRKIRKHIIKGIEKIVKLPDSVFETASVETIILFAKKESKTDKILGSYFSNKEKIDFTNLTFNSFSRKEWVCDVDSRFNIFGNNNKTSIINKIYLKGTPLEEFVFTSLGITPYDKYRGHSEELIRNKEFHAKTKLNENYVPLISGKNIHKYHISNEAGDYLNYGNWLGAPREKKFFENKKIIVRQIVGGKELDIIAGYSEAPHYFSQIGFSLISRTNDNNELKFLLALLNSKLISFYHKNKFLDTEKILFQKILIANCKKLPILRTENQIYFIELIDSILISKKENPQSNTTALERKIDELVFNLYDLTYSEVQVVCPDFWLSEEEYAAINIE